MKKWLLGELDAIWYSVETDSDDKEVFTVVMKNALGLADAHARDELSVPLFDYVNDESSSLCVERTITAASLDEAIGKAEDASVAKKQISIETYLASELTSLDKQSFIKFTRALFVALSGDTIDEASIEAQYALATSPASAAIALIADLNEEQSVQFDKDGFALPNLNRAQVLKAASEGWCLSQVFCEKPTSEYQLQKIDDLSFFESDSDAFKFVVEQAKKGSVMHNVALRFLAKHSRNEFDSIMIYTNSTMFAQSIIEAITPKN